MNFNLEQKQTLFTIARGAVASTLDGHQLVLPTEVSEDLRRPSGVFVTLKLREELRGCIGSVMPVEPLYIATAHNAIHAAFRDPRFVPLSRHEFHQVRFEISVMSMPEPVSDWDSIEVGIHGLIVRRGRDAGLLLPQVAIEYGWDRERFLGYTCMKAGLPREGWKRPDCRVEKFTAEVFSEALDKA